jgi:hypothetical protein
LEKLLTILNAPVIDENIKRVNQRVCDNITFWLAKKSEFRVSLEVNQS